MSRPCVRRRTRRRCSICCATSPATSSCSTSGCLAAAASTSCSRSNRSGPDCRVLILSVYPPEPYAIRAFRAGASGYVKKDSVGDELVKAVKTVVGGHRYVTPEIAESLAGDLNRQKPPTHDALTHREFEVMTLLASGRSVREVGEDLCLSYNTISTHRARILAKLGLKTSADLIKYTVTHKLVE